MRFGAQPHLPGAREREAEAPLEAIVSPKVRCAREEKLSDEPEQGRT
jgi:hypothetical protein